MKQKTVWFILVFVIFSSAPSEWAKAVSSEKSLLPPDILPVIILQGSDYDMGYQYGKQAGHFIEKNRDAAWADALERFSRDDVIHALKANQLYIQKYTPEWIDFMKGMADGAQKAGGRVSFTDVLLLNCTLPNPKTSTYPEGAEKDTIPPKKCSVCSAWGSTTTDGRLIGLDTLDGGEDALFGVVIVAFPDKGNAYMSVAQAGEIGDHFLMNNKGLFLGNSGGGPSRDIDDNYGLAWGCSLPYLVRFADNAVQARDMVLPWQINTPENFHFVDVEGNAFVVEKTAAVQAVRTSGDFGEKDFLYSTNNYLHKKMKITKEGEFVKQHGGYGTYAAPRNLMIWDMLHNYSGHVDAEFVKMMLRFPGDPPPYPPAEGWDAKVCRPTNSWVSVALPDNGVNGVAHICTGPAGRVIHSSTAHNGEPMHSTYRYIDGTHTFYSLQLAEDPKEVAKTSQKAAQSRLADAYREFMRMKITDQGYTALNNLYSLANTEYFQGNDALNQAILADKDEQLFYFSKAATFYSRSQTHANQVFEAFVPPPTSPSDLGLKPFGGDWAVWETNVRF